MIAPLSPIAPDFTTSAKARTDAQSRAPIQPAGTWFLGADRITPLPGAQRAQEGASRPCAIQPRRNPARPLSGPRSASQAMPRRNGNLGNRPGCAPARRSESLRGLSYISRPDPAKTAEGHSAAFSAPLRRAQINIEYGLTLKPTCSIPTLLKRETSLGSAAKKAVPGFAPCQSQGVRNRAINARFFRYRPPWAALWAGRMGPRKRATPCGGSANPVRPAHQICTLVCRVPQNHKETHHV